LIILLLYWEYIVTFTKVLIVYHSWIHPPIILLYPPPHSWSSLDRSLLHFHARVHDPSTTFTLLLPFLASSPSHCTNPHLFGSFKTNFYHFTDIIYLVGNCSHTLRYLNTVIFSSHNTFTVADLVSAQLSPTSGLSQGQFLLLAFCAMGHGLLLCCTL
jgi:hypothetical protein